MQRQRQAQKTPTAGAFGTERKSGRSLRLATLPPRKPRTPLPQVSGLQGQQRRRLCAVWPLPGLRSCVRRLTLGMRCRAGDAAIAEHAWQLRCVPAGRDSRPVQRRPRLQVVLCDSSVSFVKVRQQSRGAGHAQAQWQGFMAHCVKQPCNGGGSLGQAQRTAYLHGHVQALGDGVQSGLVNVKEPSLRASTILTPARPRATRRP